MALSFSTIWEYQNVHIHMESCLSDACVYSRMDGYSYFCNFILIWVVHVLQLRAFIIYVNKWVCLTQSSTHTQTHSHSNTYIWICSHIYEIGMLWRIHFLCVNVSSPFLNKPLVIVRNRNRFYTLYAAKNQLIYIHAHIFNKSYLVEGISCIPRWTFSWLHISTWPLIE